MEKLKTFAGRKFISPEDLGLSDSPLNSGVSGTQKISQEQREINKMMGIPDEVFLQYCKASPSDAVHEPDVQKTINKQCGIDDETFKKYGPKAQ
jgi:hypothetical protein